MASSTRGPARQPVKALEADASLRAGTLVLNERRRRPRYFDGRFLAARDLTREQTYFLTRQADLARSGGQGVVSGLQVSRGEKGMLKIAAGHGVTSNGELVVVADDLLVDLTALGEIQRLDDAFGLGRVPTDTDRANRTGLFVVALRPVEFTANPITTYPTAIGGKRSIEDGDIIEAVAVTLIPYPDDGAVQELDQRRARTAREIFVNRGTKGVPDGVLPIAMIALNRGNLQWVDPFMVRREIGAEVRDILNLGTSSQALREAHLQQYDAHLQDVLQRRGSDGRFAASLYFDCLPAAGRMPRAALDAVGFTQIYFPQEISVELSIVPEDEIGELLRESLSLPPIDLTASGATLEATSVLVLIPASRAAVLQLNSKLASLKATLKAAAPGLLAQRRPLEALRMLTPKPAEMVAVNPQASIDAAWQAALGNTTLLYYVRRSHIQYKAEVIAGEKVTVTIDDVNGPSPPST